MDMWVRTEEQGMPINPSGLAGVEFSTRNWDAAHRVTIRLTSCGEIGIRVVVDTGTNFRK